MTTVEPLLKKLDELHDYSQEAFEEVAKKVILYRNLAEKDPEQFLKLLRETTQAFEEEIMEHDIDQVRTLLGGNHGTA